MSIFTKLWSYIKPYITDVEEAAITFVDTLAHSIASSGGPLLMQIVSAAVSAAEASSGSGADKLTAAKKSIENALKDQGMVVATFVINGAIEAAVANLKASVAAKPLATPPAA